MKTSATSPASACSPTLDFCLTPLSEAPPARTSVAPTTARPKGSMAPGPAFTSTSSVSSERLDLIGMRLRTLLSSKLEASSGSKLRWRRSATPAGRPWWVLERQDTSTSESAAGLLAFMCPTPRANRWGPPDSHGQPHPMLPTPIKGNSGSNRAPGGPLRPNLATTVKRSLHPTPVSQSADRGLRAGGGSRARKVLRELYPSPLSPSSEPPAVSGLGGVRALLSITEWLMGYPPGWLACAFPPMATLSSRTSRKRTA